MGATELLDQLGACGVSVRVDRDELVLRPADKVPSGLLTQVRQQKAELIALLAEPASAETLLDRLRKGHSWLLAQHQRWQADDTSAADDEAFSRAWNGWWDLDYRLRAEYGLAGCIHGPKEKCPEGFGCIGCVEAPEPSVVAQLELAGMSA